MTTMTTTDTITKTPQARLTPQRLNAAKPRETAYKISDPATAGLFCLIQPGGTKTFGFSFRLNGKRSEVTLGKYPSYSLAEARESASAARRMVERGENPAAAKKAAKEAERAAAEPPSEEGLFRTFAAKWKAEKLAGRAASYVAQIDSRLERFVYPVIGDKGMATVTPSDVLKIIEPLQIDTPNTAEGVRGIVETIYSYAIQLDAINRATIKDRPLIEQNPALPLRGIVDVPKSEEAPHLSPKQLGRFWRALNRQYGAHPSTIAATKLLFYSMTRKTETLRAKWVEFDLDAGIWEIPKDRMKLKKPHRVYLSKQAVDLLTVQRAVTGKLEYVFPSAFRNNAPVGEATLNHLFKRIDAGVPDFSPHGTRSTAATLLREKKIAHDVVELCLAHALRGVAGRYQRQELADERRAALQLLADEIDRLAAMPDDEAE